jgi:hypothetical protein
MSDDRTSRALDGDDAAAFETMIAKIVEMDADGRMKPIGEFDARDLEALARRSRAAARLLEQSTSGRDEEEDR